MMKKSTNVYNSNDHEFRQAAAEYNTIFLVELGYRYDKSVHILRLSTNQAIFRCLHMSGTANQPDHVPSTGTSNNWTAQHLGNAAGGVGLPICCCRITFSCLCQYCRRFLRSARLKRINCVRYRSPVMVSYGFNRS